MKQRKILKGNRGITLIALVITIIVLIILATVTINVIFNDNGLIKKAEQAAEKSRTAEEQERAVIDLISRDLILGDYAQEGLMLHYDAVKNTENGHDQNASTWYDLSKHRNDGTLNGDAQWTEDSLSFDGINDWVSIGKMDYDNITLEVVMMHKNVNKGKLQHIAGNWNAGGYGILSQFGTTLFKVSVQGTYRDVFSKRVAQNDIKLSLSGRYDNKELVLFENGNKATYGIKGPISGTNKNTVMALGTNPNGDGASGDFFIGKIYSVRIYDRALTDEEVKRNYELDKLLYGVEDINE